MILDRAFSIHFHETENCEKESHRGNVAATALSLHSLLDGIGVGLAFQVSSSVGWIVAVAVLTHDFSDGINTVSVIFKDKGERKRAVRWLVVDALAPLLGILLTFFISVPDAILGLILSIFTGFFIYLGASDLIPESHHFHPTFWTTLMTVFGIGTMYLVIQLV